MGTELRSTTRIKALARYLLIGLCGVGALAVGWYLVPLLGSDPDAPTLSWADKLTAVGTVGAVLATLVITLITYFRDRQARVAEARERADFLLKQQASQIHWWFEPCPEHAAPWDDGSFGKEWLLARDLERCWGTRLVIENRSELPIHEVTPVMTLRIVLDEQYGNWSIGPAGRAVFHLAGEGECLLDSIGTPAPFLLFRDHVGRPWRRGENGALIALPQDTDLSDEMMGLSAAAYRMLHANRRTELDEAHERQRIKDVLLPLVQQGLAARNLEELAPADELAFTLLQTSPLGRGVAKTWWSWRARRAEPETLAKSLRFYA